MVDSALHASEHDGVFRPPRPRRCRSSNPGTLDGMIRRPERKEMEAAAELLWRLATSHGMSDLHLGEDPGELVAAVADDRTYFDITVFEDEVEARLGWRPAVVPSSAPGAHPGPKLTGHTSAA